MNHRILLTLCLALSAAESVHSQPLIKIAFVSDRDGNDEIYSVHPDGSDLANLTGNPADDHSPAWSPDGQRIAFVSDRGGDNDIYTMTADGTDVTNLTGDAEDDQRPAWSPDGARIAFISTREGQIDLYVMGTDGSGAVNLTMGAPGRITDGPFWSPEGSRLAFVAERDVYLVDYDGDNLTNLTQDQGSTRGPSWSPDGQRLAYTAPRNAPFSSPVYAEGSTIPVRDLFRVDVDGEGLVNLSNSLSKESAPAWSPDGTSIVVTIDRYGYEGSMAFYDETDLCLYVYSAEGSTGRKLFCSDDTHHYRTVDFPAWSPDGTMVAVQVTRRTVDRRGALDEDSGDIDIFVVPVDGSRPLNLTDHPARDHQLAWSPPLARTAGAGVFVVDTTGDMGDRDPGDGRCADEEDSCSLRTAIEEANSSAGIDTIFFAIPGPGPHTIVPMPALPAILEPVVIDGTSEPDFMGTPIIELNGSRAGSGNTGLRVRAGDSVIKGLVINRFDADGIVLEGPGNNLLQGNYIGTDISGTAGVGNGGDGVHVASGAHNTIGGRDGAGGNIIAFNGGNGASIAAGASNAILKNAIHSNGGIGIDLGRDGVTDNDDDVDANQGQNAPVLHAATTAHVISGTLDSGASSTFLIELFLNDA